MHTLQGAPDHKVGGSEVMSDKECTEREMVIKRIKRSNEVGESSDCRQLLRELEERLGLEIEKLHVSFSFI